MKSGFYHTGIRVCNLEKSLDFCTKVIWAKGRLERNDCPRGKYVHLRGGGSRQTLEPNWYRKGTKFYAENAEGVELDPLAISVKCVKKAYKVLVKSGADTAVSPKDSMGTEVYVKDPDGIRIGILRSC
ncbi:MAG: VOC family protein [Nitrososphaerales archaeon]